MEQERQPLLAADEAVNEALTMDEILCKWVGECGRAQWIHFGLTSLAWALDSMHTLVMIFVDSKTNSSSDCSRWSCATTVQEFHLTGYKAGLSQCAFFLGGMVGAGTFGSLADGPLGRKGAMLVTVLSSGILGLLTSIVPSFWMYLALRAATGAVNVIGAISFVLATECIGHRYRGPLGMSSLYFYSTGTLLLVGLSEIAAGSWRLLYVLSSIPSILYALAVLPFVDESPRWLKIRRRHSEALLVLRKMASGNGRLLPPGVVLADDVPITDDDAIRSGSIRDVFADPRLCYKLLLMTCIWFVCSLLYYGLSLNVSNLGFDIRISVLLNALMEMPALALSAMLMGRFKRRTILTASLLWSTVFCTLGGVLYCDLLVTLVPQSWVGALGAACGATALFGIAAAYNLLYIYSVELFPTVVRNAALGVAVQAGKLGAVAAPFIVQLVLHPAVPFLTFAIASAVAGLLCCCLPETQNQPLLDTLEAAKAMEPW